MITPITQNFVEQFFSSPNLFKWEIYTSGRLNKLSFCISRLEGEQPVPTIIPFMENDKTLTWFAIAFDEKSLTQLREQVRSFIGPSYSSFNDYHIDGTPHVMDQIVNTFSNGYYFTFRGNDSIIRDKASLMFQLLDKKTGKSSGRPNEPYPMLRNFELALQANEKDEAERQIQLLERYRLLDPRNILFMRIEFLAHFEFWKEIIEHPQHEDLIKASRPSRITQSLIRAVFHVYLYQHINDVEILKTTFREEVWPQYQSLYRARGSLIHPETLISFMLRAVDTDTPQIEMQRDILAVGKGTEIESILLELVHSDEFNDKKEPVDTGIPSLVEAKSLADRGRFEQAIAIALNLPSSKEQIQIMLLCAFELQDFMIDKQVASAVTHLDEAEWHSILTSRQIRVYYEYLIPYLQIDNTLNLSTRLPINWNEWLERYKDLGRFTAVELAKRGFGDWGREDFLQNEVEIDRFLENLRRDTEAEREALPYIIRYFENDPAWPRPKLKEVYLEIHRRLLMDMQGDSYEMRLATSWSETLVRLGLSSIQYRQLFEQLSYGWKNYSSINFFEMLYSFLQTVGEQPCPDQLSCWRFIHSIRDRLKEQVEILDGKWTELEKRLMPKEWETWYSALFEATEGYHFLMDWLDYLGINYNNWTPTSILRIQDWMTEWGVEEPENAKKNIISRSLLPFINYVSKDPNFPVNEDAEFYETLTDIVRLYAGKNKETLQSLFTLQNGLLLKKPEVAEIQWKSTHDWLTIQPTAQLLKVVFELMELFYDYGVPGMEIKLLWDEWIGRLYDKFDEETGRLLPFLLELGKAVEGNYLILQELQEILNQDQSGEQDPLKQLPPMTITIFSCREKAAQRAANRIMLRNPYLQVRVCTQDRATDQTKSYARQSDISIIVTDCISHALTLGIKGFLPRDPIYPRSSGEAGIVESLMEYSNHYIKEISN
ncbi:hypothetical protein OM416_27620 [Paenibacillus sp. LS1]|uniref:hypothetical protein n=1 Tax=Paenibacillus sp. LS1 TaxID=2992120 RepID=UPI00223246C8|nr:hypothetical protein [Paenibacillus sp. LS1]MCW3795381.1 hypothetical protein [Paenibacillus sp. LS1]